jgi:hypothetical protein
MKTAGAPGFESAFIPRGGQEQRRDADPLRIPNAARRCTRIHPRLLTKNLQIALTWFDPVGPTAKPSAVQTDKITLITLIRFDPVGPTAKPSTVQTDKITLITLIRFHPVGPTAKPSTVQTDRITLITLIRFHPVGPTAKPSTVQTDEITLITLIRFHPVGLNAKPSTVQTDKITFITLIRLDSTPTRQQRCRTSPRQQLGARRPNPIANGLIHLDSLGSAPTRSPRSEPTVGRLQPDSRTPNLAPIGLIYFDSPRFTAANPLRA